MKRIALIVGATALVIALAVAMGWYFERGGGSISSGGVTGTGTAAIGGAFSLTDQHGQRRTDKEFAGKYLLVYFGFTHCVDACPLALLNMSRALDALPPDAVDKLQPIFITVDPARDDVAQMALYLQNFHPKFIGLTGTVEEIGAVAKAYRVPFDAPKPDENGDYQVQHGTIVYLMAPDGSYLANFDHTTKGEDMAKSLQNYVAGRS